MLNELHDLARCLQSVQVSTTDWAAHFDPCPKSAVTYLTLLDAEGRVSELHILTDRDRIASIRRWQGANGVSFPAFNVLPLFKPAGEESMKAAAQFRKSLASHSPPRRDDIARGIETLIAGSESLWESTVAARITKCLTSHAEKLADKLGPVPEDYRAITELFSRARRITAEELHHQIKRVLTRAATAARGNIADWFDTLFCLGDKKAKNISLILELADRSQFPYPATHPDVQAWMNTRLLAASDLEQAVDGSSTASRTDAYGNVGAKTHGKFPSVRLPVLGNVILRAMSKESPCQKRYGKVDEFSFPVGHLSRRRMKSALEWLGDPVRKGRTWTDASGACGNGKKVASPAVLFAYPSHLPPLCPEIAGLLAGAGDSSDPDGARFEQYAAPVGSALEGMIREHPQTEVRVIVLMKADKARTKVVQSRCFSATHLLRAGSDWQTAARNIPFLKIRRFDPNNDNQPTWADPWVPFPLEIVSCINTAWDRAGRHAEPVPGLDVSDGLGLLLEQGRLLRSLAANAIHMLIVNSQTLLLALTQAHQQDRVHSVSKKYAKHPLLLPSILALLLAKLGRWKGDYMKGPPFLVGQLLSLADQLHLRYCYGVRKGQIPPQLVGNALMATALEQPVKALEVLSKRILPYQAWATTVQEGENIGLVKYLLAQLGRVSDDLATLALPMTCNDGEKAEMLLGYLARSAKDMNNDSTDSTTTEGKTA